MEEHRQSMAEDDMCNLPSLDEAPWLILTDDSELENKITFCSMNDKSYPKTIDELHGKYILACNQGWVFLQDRVNRSRYSLWNPVTRECLNLPELLDSPEEEQQQRPICMLTSPPDGNNNGPCVVLLIFKGIVFSCRLPMRDDDCNKWVKQSLEHNGRSVHVLVAAALNGDIYVRALVKNNDNRGFSKTFGRIKVSYSDSDSDSDGDSDSDIFEAMEIQYECESINIGICACKSDYLVEVCGVLYNVHILIRQSYEKDDYDIVKAFVSRLDLSQMKWIQVESLGNRAFLLGNSCCTWCWADTSCPGIEENCIYMTQPWSKIVHQYRLQDDSYIFLNPYLNMLQIFDNPIWFMPPRNFTKLRKSEDIKNIEHNEESDEMKLDGPITSLFCQLPTDMLRLVATYLHLFDYMNLRTTCKVLRSNIPRPQWRSNCSYPLFMSLKNTKAGICEVWDPCQNICHTVVTPHSPDLLSTIEFCKDGWLLLRIEGNSLECFNPFKGKSYKYPSYDEIVRFSGLAFSTCPTSPDCLTVGVESYDNNWVKIHYFQAEDDEWEYDEIEFDSETGIEFAINENSSPKYHDEAFYFLGVNGNLGVLRMVDEEDDEWSWSWKVHMGPIPNHILLHSCQFVELDNQLILVFIEEEGQILVFKFDTLLHEWVGIKDLGDYMLFVSPASSFSISTKDNNMKNRIYLPKRIGNEMVFYSLTTGMYQTSSNQHSSQDFYGTRSQSFSCWL